MSDIAQEGTGTVVAKVPSRGTARVGKPNRVVASAMLSKRAYGAGGGGGGIGASLGLGGGVLGTTVGSAGNFYSPELSTDFLQLGQSLDEKRQYYRFFYNMVPFVRQAVDIHTEIPLSKIRLGMPQARNHELAEKSLRFCTKWAKRINLLMRLIEIVHEYHKIGEVFPWCEDTNPDTPDDFFDTIEGLDEAGEVYQERVLKTDAETRRKHIQWLYKNYKGWTKIRILPPEQVHVETFPFTDAKLFQLIIDSKTKSIIEQADRGDPHAMIIRDSMPLQIVMAARSGGKVTLNTDPEAGSFIAYLARKRSQYEPRGRSLLESVMHTLVYSDKLRQTQTSIADRHMTPMRVVWAEGMDQGDVDALRDQIDLALMDPDHSIIANYQINWEEMPSNGRLLELSGEYDRIDRLLYAGLGVTESLLSGESSYSGDRINLEVINQRYMLLREILQEFVEENMLKPMCARMGFIEEDEDGEEVVLYPSLSFTRMGLRDNDSTFDHMFNLYQKGSLDIQTILEHLNIDWRVVQERLKRDVMTLNDPNFNELLRGLYSRLGDDIAENSDAAGMAADYLGFSYKKPDEGGGRF